MPTNVADAIGDVHIYQAAVLLGTAGSTSTLGIGYVLEDDPIVVTNAVPGRQAVRVQGKKFPVRHINPNRDITIQVPALQFQADNLATSLGVTKQGNQVFIGDSTDTVLAPQMSLAVVGQDLDDDSIRLDVPYASADPTNSTSFTQIDFGKIDPMSFVAEAGVSDATQPNWTFGDISLTIDGAGDIEITGPIHRLVGAGGAADDLNTISGTTNQPLRNGQLVRLRPSTTSYLITVKNLDATIRLLSDNDHDIGTFLSDWMDFKYFLAGTEWVEQARSSPRIT